MCASFLFFTFISCIVAQTDFLLPSVVTWENMAFEGFIQLEGSSDKIVLDCNGTLQYLRLSGNKIGNRATLTFGVGPSTVTEDTLSVWDSQNGFPKLYRQKGGQCSQSGPSLPPKCGAYQRISGTSNTWRQVCLDNDSTANMTITVNLDSYNRVLTLKYAVVDGDKTLARLSFTKTTNSGTYPVTSYFSPPSSCTGGGSDPFDPKSCAGAPLNLASKFVPGAKAAALANYTLVYGKRQCTQFTGCGEWAATTPSWGPSGKGTIWLKVGSSGITVALVDHSAGSSYGTPIYNLGADCTLASSTWNCGQYHDTEIREGANFLRFGGSDKFHGVSPTLSGVVNQKCAQWTGSVKDTTVNGSWNEYRVGLLVTY